MVRQKRFRRRRDISLIHPHAAAVDAPHAHGGGRQLHHVVRYHRRHRDEDHPGDRGGRARP